MDAPSITLTTEYGMESRKTVKFQCGLVRETETFVGEEVELLCRETLLDYVCDMLNTKVREASVRSSKSVCIDMSMWWGEVACLATFHPVFCR